jgi:O-antigen/teichoic acid export membrane protein
LATGNITRGTAPQRGGTVGAVLSNLGWLLAGKGVGAVLSLVYLGLAAHRLGIIQFGQFTLILGTGQAIVAFVGFRTWQIVMRYGMAHLRDKRFARLGRLIAFCTGLDLAAALLGCLLAWTGVAVLAPRLGWPPALSRAALLFCIVTLLSVRSTAVGVLRLFDRFALGALADSATPITRFLGSLAVVAIHPSVQGFLAAWAAGEVVTAAAYWVAVRRVAAGTVRLPRLAGAWRAPGENPGLWPFTWLSNLAVSLEAVGKQAPLLLVGLATGPAEAGNYRLATQLSQSIVRVSDMASRAIFAEFARAHGGTGAAIGRPTLGRLFGRVAGLALVGAGGLILVLLLGRLGLRLLAGPGHSDAYPLLRLLGIAAAVDLAGIGFEPLLVAMGLVRRALLLQIATTFCLAMGLAVLLPRFGGAGAASATLAASVVGLVLFGRAAWRAIALPR